MLFISVCNKSLFNDNVWLFNYWYFNTIKSFINAVNAKGNFFFIKKNLFILKGGKSHMKGNFIFCKKTYFYDSIEAGI